MIRLHLTRGAHETDATWLVSVFYLGGACSFPRGANRSGGHSRGLAHGVAEASCVRLTWNYPASPIGWLCDLRPLVSPR